MSEEDLVLLIIGITFNITGALLVWSSFYYLIRKRKIQDTPTAKIKYAAQGYVEIAGIARAPENFLLISPLAKQPCLFYTSFIRKKGGKGGHTVFFESEKTKFIPIDDGTGVCFVPFGDVEILGKTMQWGGDDDQTGPAYANGKVKCLNYGSVPHGINGVLTSPSLLHTTGTGSSKYYYEETIIAPGDKVYALGNFKTLYTNDILRLFNDYFLQQIEENLLDVWNTKFESLLTIYDENKDGLLSGDEREKIKDAASKLAKKDFKKNKTTKYKVNILEKPDDIKAHPYIISRTSQKKAATVSNNQSVFTMCFSLLWFGFGIFALIKLFE